MEKKGSRKKVMQVLSLLLAAMLFLGTQGGNVFAETISGNEGTKDWKEGNEAENEYSQSVTESGSSKEGDCQKDDTKHLRDEGQEEEPISEGSVSGNGRNENGAGTGKEIPENPIHHCSKWLLLEDDTTTWSYVYFGSYPQSEVTDSATIAAIDKEIEKYGKRADAGRDVWVDGIKYRRIDKYDTISKYDWNTESYNGYRYFKWERMKWKVLKNDGNTLFVVSDMAIDCKHYNEKRMNTTWETSTLRNWLNTSFYDTAFSRSEQSAIVAQKLANEDNPYSGIEGGNDTEDKVYLLSMREMADEGYGFCSDPHTSSMSRRIKASNYADARGVTWESNSWGWLRSPGITGEYVAIFSNGFVVVGGEPVTSRYCDVCPALHIDLSSGIWSMTDDKTSGRGDEKTANPETSIPTGSRVPPNTKLTLSCTTVGADIYYTTDGTLPTIESPLYKKEITIDCDRTIKAVAMYKGYAASDVVEFFYKVQQSSSEGEQEEESDNKENGNKNGGSGSEENKGSNVKVQKLTIKAPSKKLAAGKKVKLTLNVTPKNATNKAVKWSTSNKKYATVDKNGMVTLKKKGIGKNVTITATAQDGSGKKASLKIKIMRNAVKSIKLTAPKKTLKAGKVMTIKAAVKTTGNNANKTLAWKSSNKKYATVSKKGKVTAKKAGKGKTVTITAASTDGSNKKAKVKIKIR